MIPSQMLKGTLDGCILGIISQREVYGYEISHQLSQLGFGAVSEGTIYPLLLRLERNGFLSATYRDSEQGPRRKYYALTDTGRQEFQTFVENFEELRQAVTALLRQVQSGPEGDIR